MGPSPPPSPDLKAEDFEQRRLKLLRKMTRVFFFFFILFYLCVCSILGPLKENERLRWVVLSLRDRLPDKNGNHISALSLPNYQPGPDSKKMVLFRLNNSPIKTKLV